MPRLDLVPGERVALVGPSGCGKSTLLDLLALTAAPLSAGRFRLAPAGAAPLDVAEAWKRGRSAALGEARRRHLGYVLQTGGLLPYLTIARNLGLPCRLCGYDPAPRVGPLAEVLGIAGHLKKKPAALSVGERQRAAIARALAHGPELVLADEPTASVDPLNAEAILKLLVALTEGLEAVVVLATHDAEMAARFGFRRLEHRLRRDAGDGATVASFGDAL